jgi:hypothetical protein
MQGTLASLQPLESSVTTNDRSHYYNRHCIVRRLEFHSHHSHVIIIFTT